MRLTPTAEQQELKDAVRRFCEQQVTPERLAQWDQTASGVDADCWRMVATLGWFGLGVPSSAGGSGLGLVEIACLLEECARGLIPRRVINAVRGGVALAQLDPRNRYLDAVARGDCVVALALDEPHTRVPATYRSEIRGTGDHARLYGEKSYVAEAADADLHVVAARESEQTVLVLVSGEHAQATPLRTFDGERQAVVRYHGVPIVQRLAADDAVLRALRRRQTALALAEMIGGMDATLAMTVAYVKEREQFGQKLAVFQAVQHQIADMAMAYTGARDLGWQAITRLASGSEQGAELAMAAAFAGQAFKRVSLSAHHLHGGAGYVIEHPLHYHAERAQSLCIRHTPEARALDAVAAALLDS